MSIAVVGVFCERWGMFWGDPKAFYVFHNDFFRFEVILIDFVGLD